VVFRDGKPARREYRHFNIKTVVGANDFASMAEVVTRRYSRVLAEGGELPDLVVIDGGKGQLGFAYNVLKGLGLENKIVLIGLAKRLEEVFFPNDPTPHYLDKSSESLKILMHIRDEAHRFGIAFHRQKRSINFIKSELEEIPGLGKTSVEKLLKKFKTISKIKKATVEELTEVVGKARGEAVVQWASPHAKPDE
jgi:excinuclease ABC subunit C